MARNSYLLHSHAAEYERLTQQALVWEHESRKFFSAIGVNPGWRCVDVACGPVGVLPVLSDLVAPEGHVTGLDIDHQALQLALQQCAGRGNVSLRKANIFEPESLARGFRLVHGRFLLAPLGNTRQVMTALRSMAEPGGSIALQEPDLCTWQVSPRSKAMCRLIESIRHAFQIAGGNLNAGAGLERTLRESGCTRVRTRRVALHLPQGHPYLELPLQMARSLGLNDNFDECRQHLQSRPGTTFTLVQCWGTA